MNPTEGRLSQGPLHARQVLVDALSTKSWLMQHRVDGAVPAEMGDGGRAPLCEALGDQKVCVVGHVGNKQTHGEIRSGNVIP